MNNATKSTEEPILIEDHNFSFDDLGRFFRHNKIEDVGTYQSGPLTITIESAEVTSGNFSDDYNTYGITSNDEIKTVNFQVRFKLDEKEKNVFFTEENMHLVTNTGEKVEKPHELISSAINVPIINNNNNVRQVAFKIEETDIENLKEVQLNIDAPINDKGEPLGDNLEIEIKL
ncbi:hypothetical protein [Oceanobacillus massiliensis]|uniref:hypothetical protein n=1 Tax=Oceanobacillus massiliensis TaxID=1465765 RepID=UPI000289B70A|nr:hypothetical protein [Oceanobacillus massiliensis]